MTRRTIDLQYPFHGFCLIQNSPANRIPSHGTHRFALAHSIDLVPTDALGRTARIRAGSLIRAESPERFPGFGIHVTAPASGRIIAAHDEERDHDVFRGLPSIYYALTQRRRLREGGWRGVAGNHIAIHCDGVVVIVCHLRRHSIRVAIGDEVTQGEVIAQCGNSGSSTEPHVHLQAMTSFDVERAESVPITLAGRLPRNGEVIHSDR
ncbi:MAG: M23 family metallopeptidase [Gulosibacter sp.]|uniref:M23 family metallopeptidase n=1 Tax=Gulosibacter sp. TaxID=2817531 RepID=UPI003F901C5B